MSYSISYPASSAAAAAQQGQSSSTTPTTLPTISTAAPAAAAYPYSAYQHPHQMTYAWPYPYSYQQLAAQAQQSRPATTATVGTSVTPLTTATFSSYVPTATTLPTYHRESSAVPRSSRRSSNLKGLFAKELPKLMYGFGDDKMVSNDTVAVMEEILIEYIADVCQTALAPTKKSRLQIEDLRRALGRRTDAKKLARMEELLFMQEDIRRARKQFDDSEVHVGGGRDF